MASVYGDILTHFPELVIRLPYFSQEPKVGAGFVRNTDTVYIECVRQTGLGRRLSGSIKSDFNAISPVLKFTDQLLIWTQSKLTVGYFMIYNEEVYRISSEKNWELEGGYFSYKLEKVVGNNGSEEQKLGVKVGEF